MGSSGAVLSVVNKVVPMYVAMVLGWYSARRQIVTVEGYHGLQLFLVRFCIPCLMANVIVRKNLYEFNVMVLVAIIVHAAACFLLATIAVTVLFHFPSFTHTPSTTASRIFVLFSILVFPNALVVGVPIMVGMYGPDAETIQVFIVVAQTALIIPSLVVLGEIYKVSLEREKHSVGKVTYDAFEDPTVKLAVDGKTETVENVTTPTEAQSVDLAPSLSPEPKSGPTPPTPRAHSTLLLVLRRLLSNEVLQASIASLLYSLIAYRINPSHQPPDLLLNTMTQFSTCVGGLALFNIGVFMHSQPLFPGRGQRLAVGGGLLLRLVISPLLMGAVAAVLGIRGMEWRIIAVQAALPQAIVTFTLAQYYGAGADVLGACVTLGTLVSLPVLVFYYWALELVPNFMA